MTYLFNGKLEQFRVFKCFVHHIMRFTIKQYDRIEHITLTKNKDRLLFAIVKIELIAFDLPADNNVEIAQQFISAKEGIAFFHQKLSGNPVYFSLRLGIEIIKWHNRIKMHMTPLFSIF